MNFEIVFASRAQRQYKMLLSFVVRAARRRCYWEMRCFVRVRGCLMVWLSSHRARTLFDHILYS